MMSKEKIEKLLEDYLNNRLDSEATDELFEILNKEAYKNEVDAWFYKNWKSEDYSLKTSLIEDRLRELRQQLNISMPHDDAILTRKTGKSKKAIGINVFKYAAVFAIIFSLAWMVRGYVDEEKTLFTDTSMNSIFIPYGSKSAITLADGTKIWLNAGSTLQYPQHFSGDIREVKLEGEAYFEVTHNEKKPFFVKTSDITIEVKGTAFNVKSYPEEKHIETTLVSGSIVIHGQNPNSGKIINLQLEPNQRVKFSKEKGKFKVYKPEITEKEELPALTKKKSLLSPIPQDFTDRYTSWKDEKLVFDSESFEELELRMERWYGVDIEVKDEKLKGYSFTGVFEKETLEKALDALQLTTPFEYYIEKDSVIITSN